MPLAIRAPAKINLALRLVGKRPDGYHELETIFLMIDWCDELEVRCIDRGISLSCDDPALPSDERNLVYRAARLLADEAGIDRGAHLHLQKRLPLAAGLGGGSSDAASTLLALNYLWELHWPRTKLAALAARLGADVPFFLTAPCAIGTGIGTTLEPLPVKRKWPVLLINPGYPVNTAWVYRQAKLPLTVPDCPITLIASHLLNGSLRRLEASARNDLQNTVTDAYPEVGRIIEMTRRCGAPWVFMSGSGPTVVACFTTHEAARGVAACLQREGALHWRVNQQSTIIEFAEVYPSAVLDVAN